MNEKFRRFAEKTATICGSPWAFCVAAASIVVWLLSGPLFHFSDTWQLVINTSTTIITFLMVFLIQNTQNRDARAMHLKLDELLRLSDANDSMIDIEHISDVELKRLQDSFRELCRRGNYSKQEEINQHLEVVEKEIDSRQQENEPDNTQ